MSNNKFKILVVEDESNISSFIETLLETSGYHALVADTCAMGLTLFASHTPDLVDPGPGTAGSGWTGDDPSGAQKDPDTHHRAVCPHHRAG